MGRKADQREAETNANNAAAAASAQQSSVAQQQENRSAEQHKYWNDNYKQVDTDLIAATNHANENMGTADADVLERTKATAFNGLSSGFGKASKNLTRSLAKRGLSNSGVAVGAFGDLENNAFVTISATFSADVPLLPVSALCRFASMISP